MRRRLTPAILALAAGLLAYPSGVRAQDGAETVAVDGMPREIPVLERQGHRFVALDRIAELLGGQVVETGPERARLEVDRVELLVLRRLPYVRFEGRWYQMPEVAQKDAAGYWLPASTLHHLLPILWPGRFLSGSLGPRPPDGRPVGGPPAARPSAEPAGPRPGEVEQGTIGRGDLDRIDVWAGPGRTRLGFRMVRSPGVSVDAHLPGALQLRLTGATIPDRAVRGLAGVGLVDSASVAGTGDESTLTLWLAGAASVYSVAPLRTPAGFEVVLIAAPVDEANTVLAADAGRSAEPRRADRRPAPWRVEPGGDPGPAAAAAAGSGEAAPPPATVRPPAGGAWKVVVDAGHGGHDPGALGPQGTREKAVTLAIARALADRLEDADVEVVLTRDDDTFVALGERTRVANREGADLFVSIHANSAANASAEGFETYFLSAAKTEDARRVARMENSAIRYENPAIDPESLDELNFILWDLAQNEYLRESSALAEAVQEELGRRLSLRNRGVKQAPFFVLNGAFMPAILFETAFISNPREESLLNDPAFRNRLVDGLAESILAFLERHGRRAAGPVAAR